MPTIIEYLSLYAYDAYFLRQLANIVPNTQYFRPNSVYLEPKSNVSGESYSAKLCIARSFTVKYIRAWWRGDINIIALVDSDRLHGHTIMTNDAKTPVKPGGGLVAVASQGK